MTDWLPIETFPYDGDTWGIFRGGEIQREHRNERDPFDPPCVVGMGSEWEWPNGKLIAAIITEYDNGRGLPIEYQNPTEWLPLEILDMIEPHHVTALRIMR